MKYENITRAVFRSRPNRFIAEVEIDGRKEKVHVKNTGRCRELLLPGSEVWLTAPKTPGRKTNYDLVAVRKANGILFNIDSQAPNKAVREWLSVQGYSCIIPEYQYGNSRIDFYMEKPMEQGTEKESAKNPVGKGPGRSVCEGPVKTARKALGKMDWEDLGKTDGEALEKSGIVSNLATSEKSDSLGVKQYLMEVKGCTLEKNGIGYFPDAPTERGVKHIRELIRAKEAGYEAILVFVIQMDGVTEVRPNIETHPEFGTAMEDARASGVQILCLSCHVEPDELVITGSLRES